MTQGNFPRPCLFFLLPFSVNSSLLILGQIANPLAYLRFWLRGIAIAVKLLSVEVVGQKRQETALMHQH